MKACKTKDADIKNCKRTRSYWSTVGSLRVAFCVIAVILGGLQAWAGRFVIGSDGISYLDIGDAYFGGNWGRAINAYWSPLYSWLLGLAMLVLRPSAYWEFPVVHLVNFGVYLAALICFDFLLHRIVPNRQRRVENSLKDGYMDLPHWAWLALGYSIFIWSSLHLIGTAMVSPDMCVAVCVYLAASMLIRIQRGISSWSTFILLGLALGFGYLAKAAMFPLAFVFFLVALLAVGNLRQSIPRLLAALMIFSLIAGPFVAALSISKRRLTFGDSGKLAYAWFVNRATYRHWQGEPPASGTPLHSTRKLLDEAPAYEFGKPVGGTYPLWYDPSYWYEGVTVHFDFGQQMSRVITSTKTYYGMFLNLHLRQMLRNGSLAALFSPILLVGLLLLWFPAGRRFFSIIHGSPFWVLLIPAVAAFIMYSLVYVETRYVAPFASLFYLGVFSGICPYKSRQSLRLMTTSIVAASLLLIVSLGVSTARMFRSGSDEHWQIAEGLKTLGVGEGKNVATLKYANLSATRWARLARIRIVAEVCRSAFVNDENDFWAGDTSVRERIIASFANAGASAIISCEVPNWAKTSRWQMIGKTNCYAYFIDPDPEIQPKLN